MAIKTIGLEGPQIAQPAQLRPTRIWRIPADLALPALVLVALAVRVPGIQRPLVGHFATKNVTYAMIARNCVTGRSPAAYPALDCVTGGRRGWHLLEFPVSAYLAGAGWSWFGGSLDVWGRATSIGFSVGAVLLLYLLVRRWHGRAAACGAGVALALAPVSIIFGQSFMLEASVVFFAIAAFWCLETWLATRRTCWLVLAAFSVGLLLLSKIYMLVLVLPLAAIARRGWRIELLVASVLAVAPALAWCANVARVSAPDNPLSERVFDSLRRSADVHRAPQRLLATWGFYRKLLDDLTGPVLTPLGFVLGLVGLMNRAWRRHLPWLLATALLVAALPAKFHELLYYDMVLLPPLCILVGLGWQLVALRLRPSRAASAALLSVGLLLSLRYAVGPAFATPAEDRSVTAAAAALREVAADDEPVLTMHGWCTDLLYYCDRAGWGVSPDDPRLPEWFALAMHHSARWCVATNLAQLDACPLATAELSRWSIAREGDDFRVYRLSQP